MLAAREFENVGGSALEEFNKTINSLVSEPACEEASDSPACAMPEEDCKCLHQDEILP